MKHRRATAISITVLTVALIAIVQYVSWNEHQRFNPTLWLFLPLLLPPLLALRRKRSEGRSSPPEAPE